MFAKPFQVKTNCQLKGSTRKKFRSDLLKAFPTITEESFNAHIPNKEAISLMKVFTHTKDVVFVYSIEKGPVAFEKDGQLFPALYLLWHYPDLVYSFTTWPQVLDKIKNGADLMLPGVVSPGGVSVNAYGKLEKGDCVSINLVNNKAPIAVGVAAHSSHDMYMCGGHGKCVNILHFVGDMLWSQGVKFNIPELGPPPGFDKSTAGNAEVDSVDDDDDDDEEEESENDESEDEESEEEEEEEEEDVVIFRRSSSEDDDKVEEEEGTKRMANASGNANQEDTTVPELEEKFQGLSSQVLTTAEAMDRLLRFCFIKALKTSALKVDLPILTSSFFKVHMLPACPPGKSIDVKKSSFKKLGKFLDELASEKIITLKELSKGVMSITAINYSHEAILTFLDLDAVEEEGATVLTGHSRVGKCICGLVHSEQTYTVTPSVLPIFSIYSNKLGDQLSALSVKKVLSDYINSKSLLSKTDKSKIECDGALAKAVLGISSSEQLTLNYDDLSKRIMARMLDTSALPPPKVHKEDKGKLTPVDIQTASRTGNKKVTLVSNLEPYGVDIMEFAKECQRGVAASTTINPLPGKKGVQLQVQGNQVRFVSKLLHDKYQVPLANMRGLDKAPKVKGKKKAPSKSKPR